MSTPSARRNRRQRGGIEELPSGGLRVYAYAGIDPLTGRRHYLRESIPAGPSAQAEADKAMRRLATEVDERRNPRTSATVNQLLDRHFELAELEQNTLTNNRNLAAKHLRPLIGTTKVGELDGYLFDSFYATLRRCRDWRHVDFVSLLSEHRERCDERAAALGLTLSDEAFVFSLAVDGTEHLKPDSVSQRYARLARRLGISTTIHKLRHYSATELISAGVDVRTVAGWLGYGSGGTTTLKVYAA